SVLVTILFSIMINDLPTHIKNCVTFLFADDTQIIICGQPDKISELIELIKDDLLSVMNWMKVNHMKLNLDKTEFMIVGHPRITKTIGNIVINLGGTTLQNVNSIKCLGLLIDNNLNWTDHVSSVVKKCNSTLWALYPLQPLLNELSRKMLINAYILPVIRYMIPVWYLFSKSSRKEVNYLLKKSGILV